MSFVASQRGTQSYFLSYIKQRIERNKNFLCAITGQTGSGKSYSAMRIGEILDADFNIRRVVFTPREFMELINSGELRRGSVIVFDEAGVGMSAQEWQSVSNRLLNYILQTFRHKNYVVIFTSPHMGFMAAPSRKLLHAHMETVGISQKEKLCKLKPLLIQVNQRSGDAYFKYLRVAVKGKGVIPVKRLSIGLPSPGMVKAYEEKKNAYTHELNQSILADLEQQGDAHTQKLAPMQEKVFRMLQEGKTTEEIVRETETSERNIRFHMAQIRKKGHNLIPRREHKTGRIIGYAIEKAASGSPGNTTDTLAPIDLTSKGGGEAEGGGNDETK